MYSNIGIMYLSFFKLCSYVNNIRVCNVFLNLGPPLLTAYLNSTIAAIRRYVAAVHAGCATESGKGTYGPAAEWGSDVAT